MTAQPHTATEIRAAVAAGATTARAVTEAALARIGTLDGDLHCFITVCADHALRQADELDRALRAGAEPGPLCGVPFSVKDLYATEGVPTTYGSRIFADHVPARDAVLVERIRRAGGILVGKTNTPEFAIYIRTVNDLLPETVNPWDRRRTTGGSSGGAAASVAAGLTPIAVGSDGGGSVRIPSALCGVVGLMPSRGSIPRTGGYIGTRRFSAAGPITSTAEDALALWQVMRGPHESDPLSQSFHRTGLPPAPDGRPPRLRWIGDSGVPGAEDDVVTAVHTAATRLAALLGGRLEETGLSMLAPRFAEAFYDIMQADRVSTGGGELLADATRNALLTDYGRHQFERGSQVTGAAYSRAVEVQLTATEHLRTLLSDVDFLVTPTLAFVAPEIPSDGTQALPEDARRGFVAFTYLMNYTGFPAITLPAGLVRGMPVGLQLIGRPGTEETLLRLGREFQHHEFRMPAPPGRPGGRADVLEGQSR